MTGIVQADVTTNGEVVQVAKKDKDLFVVDLDHLTIDEIETIEEVCDCPIDAIQDPRARKGKVLRAIAFVIGKRDDPEFTLEMAGKKRISFESMPVPPTQSSDS